MESEAVQPLVHSSSWSFLRLIITNTTASNEAMIMILTMISGLLLELGELEALLGVQWEVADHSSNGRYALCYGILKALGVLNRYVRKPFIDRA